MRIFGLKATLYAHNCVPQGAKPRNIRIFTTKVNTRLREGDASEDFSPRMGVHRIITTSS